MPKSSSNDLFLSAFISEDITLQLRTSGYYALKSGDITVYLEQPAFDQLVQLVQNMVETSQA